MNVELAILNKKENSTKNTATFVSVEGHLIDNCNLLNPTIIFNLSCFNMSYNYAYIIEFNRYYYIDDITILSNNRVSVSFVEDYLASWKTTIKNTPFIFDRTPYNNPLINEELYPLSNTSELIEYIRFDMFGGNYFYVLVDIIASGGSNVNPTTTTYLMTTNELKELIEKMYTADIYGEGIQAVGDIMMQTICNPLQYISGVRFCPINPPFESLSENKIKVGWTNIDVSFTPKIMNSISDTVLTEIIIPDLANSKTDSIELFIPVIGVIHIDNEYHGQTLTLKRIIDFSTGAFHVQLLIDNKIIDMKDSNIMPSYPLSGITHDFNIASAVKDVTSFAYGISKGLTDLLSGNDLGTSIKEGAFSAINAMSSNKAFSISKSNGSVGEILQTRDIVLYVLHTDMIIEHSDKNGYPNCIETIITDNGFYRVLVSNLGGDMLSSEKEVINSIIKNGFYYE